MNPFHVRQQAWDLVVQRQRWQRDALRHTWALAQRRLDDALAGLHPLQSLHRQALEGQMVQGAIAWTVDPWRKQARLDHLCLLAERLARQSALCEDLRRVCDEQRRLCTLSQQRLQAMEDQHERSRSSMAVLQRRLQATVADHDWLLHRQWSGRPGPGA